MTVGGAVPLSVRRALPLLLFLLVVATVAVRPTGLNRRTPLRPPSASHAPAALLAADDAPSFRRSLTAARRPAPRVVLGGATSQRLVALTFDLDMTPSMAAEIQTGTSWFNSDAYGYLLAQHIHATMFMTGMWAEIYPTIARAMAQNRQFEIGNHSFSHPAFHLPCYQLGSVSRSAQAMQIKMAQQAIAWTTGVTPHYFRFPGGCYDPAAVNLVHAAGLMPIEWNVNSIDAFNTDAAQIATTVVSEVKPGSIVIMHLQGGANAPATAPALKLLVPALERRGYRFVTVSELLAAAPALQPTDPREVVEAAPPPTPRPTPIPTPPPTPVPRWCGWVPTVTGRYWVCR